MSSDFYDKELTAATILEEGVPRANAEETPASLALNYGGDDLKSVIVNDVEYTLEEFIAHADSWAREDSSPFAAQWRAGDFDNLYPSMRDVDVDGVLRSIVGHIIDLH